MTNFVWPPLGIQLLILGLIFVFLPALTFRSKGKAFSARNNLFIIMIDDRTPRNQVGGIWLQEWIEFRLKHTPLLFIWFWKPWKRRMEIFTHECEVQANTMFFGANEDYYRLAKAKVIHRGYDGIFKGMSQSQVYQAMIKHRSRAKTIAKLMGWKIKKIHKKYQKYT